MIMWMDSPFLSHPSINSVLKQSMQAMSKIFSKIYMMMKSVSYSYVVVCTAVLVAVVMVSWEMPAAEAVTCNPMELMGPCAIPFATGILPTPQCCMRMRDQQNCMCDYLRNPVYKEYLDSDSGIKITALCGLPSPRSMCPQAP
ncbi:hypothetical protein EZV62_004969 [Acer yangbiense]|uniref:Uncharacterized protein n=1 Tax=Acer yangbiense TaxID=1000413 RepID=A0A5C7IMI3_9ROSI|nr:hypothetical protein EZV62_004966 [Acer yangbiense]TXG70034.1 hypothetical protein EZV62_004969 [Acer yangbiense]